MVKFHPERIHDIQIDYRRIIMCILTIVAGVQIKYTLFSEQKTDNIYKHCMELLNIETLYFEEPEILPYEIRTPFFQYIYDNNKEKEYFQIGLTQENQEVEIISAKDIGLNVVSTDDLAANVQKENDRLFEQNVIQENSKGESLENEVTNQSEVADNFEIKCIYDDASLHDVEYIKKEFFAEDPTTKIKDELLSYEKLMDYDASIKQDNSKPQILIYHTHSQEGYVDSDKSDAATTIMGVGEYLSELLRKQYGFNVIHHLGMYDVESRDYAYSKAAVGIEQVLKENPSIEVMIDLHRDEVKGDTKLVTNIDGKNMAKFMFFNGLCYTKELGELKNLKNEYIQENISTAFQMQLMAKEYYPGLTRKTYLKGYRYNLQYRPKSLLIELGAQTNTLEEAMNSCVPMARIIAKVLMPSE